MHEYPSTLGGEKKKRRAIWTGTKKWVALSPDILLTVFLFDIGMWYLQDYYPEQFSLFMLVPLISRHSKKNGPKGGGWRWGRKGV